MPAVGFKHSAETRQKMSDAKKGKPSSFKGKTHTAEARVRIGQVQLGNQKALGHRGNTNECGEGCTCGRHTALHLGGWKLTGDALARVVAATSANLAKAYRVVGPSSIEAALLKWLQEQNCVVEHNKHFGRYFVDCYLPEWHLGFEADGYFHFNPERQASDRVRDQWLWDNHRLPIIRLTGAQIRKLVR